MSILRNIIWLFLGLLLFSCQPSPSTNVKELNRKAQIFPTYANVTMPLNIAPLNFRVVEKGEAFYLRISNEEGSVSEFKSRDGVFRFTLRKWKKLLNDNKGKTLNYEISRLIDKEWECFQSFQNVVSTEKIDPFLYYRLLKPGYESWSEISIVQRSLEDFTERTVIDNNVVGQNCVNCHAFNQQNPDNFMFHMRGSLGGTYFVKDGDLQKFKLKTQNMKNGTTYPRWHPSGKFVAFSSNKVVQRFHSKDEKKIEVSDLNSSLILYDVEHNKMQPIRVDVAKQFMDTYPEWSPNGNYLYFCRAKQIGREYDYRAIKYNLCRVKFNAETKSFAEVETIFDAEKVGKSVSFPRIAPNGKSLVFTLHNYGNFSIWHKEADLYSINLSDLNVSECNVNSDFTESYHSWASNGRWMVFSSKRGDGLTARPYIAYVNENGMASTPFVLPQEDPDFYKSYVKTFNIPELAQSDITFSPGEIRKAAKREAIQTQWVNK